MHGFKYIKCNSSYKVEYHREIVWCCKANFKTNLSKLETRKEEPYTYSFKCINYKEEHQANSNVYLFLEALV